MNFAQGSQEFRIESQNLSKQGKLFLGERLTEQRTVRISGELKELSDVCLYILNNPGRPRRRMIHKNEKQIQKLTSIIYHILEVKKIRIDTDIMTNLPGRGERSLPS